jgi:hypothetical protein
VRRFAPAHDAGHSSLKHENDAYSGVESTKVVGHGGEVEARPLRECRVVGRYGDLRTITIFGRDDLLK